MLLRLNKFLSMQGAASRREADRLIVEGRVQVNGTAVEDLGVKIDPAKDKVAVDGRTVKAGRELIHLALNKPAGYLVTKDDPEGRPTVMSLLPKSFEAVFPVGRLGPRLRGPAAPDQRRRAGLSPDAPPVRGQEGLLRRGRRRSLGRGGRQARGRRPGGRTADRSGQDPRPEPKRPPQLGPGGDPRGTQARSAPDDGDRRPSGARA